MPVREWVQKTANMLQTVNNKVGNTLQRPRVRSGLRFIGVATAAYVLIILGVTVFLVSMAQVGALSGAPPIERQLLEAAAIGAIVSPLSALLIAGADSAIRWYAARRAA